MKALRFSRYGAPDVLTVAEVPEPHAGPGEVRIAVRAAGVSPGDAAMRSGEWRDRVPLALPHVVGVDAAGVVDEIGTGVDGVSPGDEVFGLRFRGWTTATYALLDAWAPKPATMSWTQAGGAAGSIETAVRTLDALAVGRDTTLLVDGATGGVGAIMVQLAVARGARVIGTASTPNHTFLAGLGATPIGYGPGLPDRVRQATAGRRVDAAVDVAGRGEIDDLVALTGDATAVVTLVNPAAEARGVQLLRFDPTADHAAALAYGAGLVAAGKLVVHVAEAYPMEAGPAAHASVASGHTRGKIVITVP